MDMNGIWGYISQHFYALASASPPKKKEHDRQVKSYNNLGKFITTSSRNLTGMMVGKWNHPNLGFSVFPVSELL